MKIQVDIPCLRLDGPEWAAIKDKEEELKEWIWQNHKEKLLGGMNISFSLTEEDKQLEQSRKKLSLLDTISQVHKMFMESEPLDDVFGCLLDGVLRMADSECGFMGELKHEENGKQYMEMSCSRTNSYRTPSESDIEFFKHPTVKFYDMNNLFGYVITSKKPVLSNDLPHDKRAKGTPIGHPFLANFLGMPFFDQQGNVIGLVGVANKPGSYTDADTELLEPFCLTCSNINQAYLQIQRNEHLINMLEQKVASCTLKLQIANKDLEEANKRVTKASVLQLQHFACMSHEIRTPLNCIIGMSSLLQDSGLNPMQEESLKMIISSGDLLLTVVNDVLDYAKLETGNVEIEIQRRNLQETLNAVVHSIKTKAQSKELTLRTHYASDVPEYVTTDSRRLQQILFNLLGNAIKFSQFSTLRNRQIELSVTICQETCIKKISTGSGGCQQHSVSYDHSSSTLQQRCRSPSPSSSALVPEAKKTNPMLRFVVKDYGKGINKKDFERIFEPFRQASAETEDVYGGTGLGLAITARLVHGLGGRISVDSEEGCWAKFTVDLPLMDGEMRVNMSSITTNLQDTTVLLIHDEDDEDASCVTRVFSEFQADYMRFNSCLEMEDYIVARGALKRDRSYICLVKEELFVDESYQLLSNLASKSALLTYGPRYMVKESQGHYGSLSNILPSVLMNSMTFFINPTPTRRPSFSGKQSFTCESALFRDYRVLIAEDNSVNQKVLVRMLKRMDIHHIVVVDNGRKAVDREEAEPFDLVLMDLQMPVMDGLEACELIHARRQQWGSDAGSRHAVADVVFVTAHVSRSFEAMCERAGAIDFLPKPFNLEDIGKCFHKVHQLREKRRHDDLFVDGFLQVDALDGF